MQSNKVGSAIWKARLEHKITQKELAKYLGVSDKAVSRWERGAGYPNITLILKLVKTLGIDLNKLLKSLERNE